MAFDQWQLHPVPGRFAREAGLQEAAAKNLGCHVPEFPAFAGSSQFHLTDEIGWQIQGRFHQSRFPDFQLSVKSLTSPACLFNHAHNRVCVDPRRDSRPNSWRNSGGKWGRQGPAPRDFME
jgi:hypothetical protein